MDNLNNSINIERITDLIRQYHQTENRKERRRIENKILSETVWQEPLTDQVDEYSISGDDVEVVYSALPDNAQEAKRVLRALYVD